LLAPAPTYQERAVSGWYGYGPTAYGPSYQYNGGPYSNATTHYYDGMPAQTGYYGQSGYYGQTGYSMQPAYTTGYNTGYQVAPGYPAVAPMVVRPPVRYFRRHVTMRRY